MLEKICSVNELAMGLKSGSLSYNITQRNRNGKRTLCLAVTYGRIEFLKVYAMLPERVEDDHDIVDDLLDVSDYLYTQTCMIISTYGMLSIFKDAMTRGRFSTFDLIMELRKEDKPCVIGLSVN